MDNAPEVKKLLETINDVISYAKWGIAAVLGAWGIFSAWLSSKIKKEVETAGKSSVDGVERSLHNMRVKMVDYQMRTEKIISKLADRIDGETKEVKQAVEYLKTVQLTTFESYKKTVEAIKIIFEKADKLREQDRKELERIKVLVDRFVAKGGEDG